MSEDEPEVLEAEANFLEVRAKHLRQRAREIAHSRWNAAKFSEIKHQQIMEHGIAGARMAVVIPRPDEDEQPLFGVSQMERDRPAQEQRTRELRAKLDEAAAAAFDEDDLSVRRC